MIMNILQNKLARVLESLRIRGATQKVIARLSKATGLIDVLIQNRLRKGYRTIMMMYHQVFPFKDDLLTTCWGSIVPPEAFERQIQYLTRNYEILSFSQLSSLLKKGDSLPRKSAVITFDDGYQNNFLYAYPILRRYDVPATIFITTGYVGREESPFSLLYAINFTNLKNLSLTGIEGGLINITSEPFSLTSPLERWRAFLAIWNELGKLPREKAKVVVEEIIALCDVKESSPRARMLNWEEMKEMEEGKIEFGAHTVHHPHLTILPLEEVRREIFESKRELEGRLGKPVNFFAYPYGEFNETVKKIVKDAGFTCAVTMQKKWISPLDNPYELGRIAPSDDFYIFQAKIAGIF